MKTLRVDPELTLRELEALYMVAVQPNTYSRTGDCAFMTTQERAAANRAIHKLRVILDDTGRTETFKDRLWPESSRVINVPE